ncbi:MAG: hypothetical protein K1Y36_24655 [Blastocatellia bacterium]|nr:hypothetical protein [Blastocatellia bacterium]
MKPYFSVALVGNYNASFVAHQAIPEALRLAGEANDCHIRETWVPSEELAQNPKGKLADYAGVWCVPGSPYTSMEGALNAIRYARETGTPFVGTCGGFQHALIEYARNVLGLTEADHAESNPEASLLFISRLTCSLAGVRGRIFPLEGTQARVLYDTAEAEEEYQCNFGFNPLYEPLLENQPLRISGRDGEGEVRIVELVGHPFFMATLFQPERWALQGRNHPLPDAFVKALRR